MKIARLPSKRKNIILLAALIIGLPLLTYAAYQAVQLISNASADTQPRNLVLSNLTTASVVISWTTDSATRGSVSLVENGTEKSPVVDKRGNTKRFTHYVELTGLEPNTTYSFIITSDSSKYSKSSNSQFTFKTAPVTATTATPNPIHGTVADISGDDIIVFAILKDKSSYPVSATMPSGGNWIMDLSIFRKTSDKSLVLTSESTNLVIIAVTGTEKAGVLTGAYSELFDSNGKLNSTKTISLASNTTFYATYFPSAAQLVATEVSTGTDDNTDTNTGTDTNNNTGGNGSGTDTNTNTNSGTTINGRVFRLVKDLSWKDMVSTTSVGWTSGASTVQTTNLTDTGFTVVWVSSASEQGYVNYGTSASSLTSQAIDERDSVTNKGSYYVHSVSLSRLQPETKYYFEIVSGSSKYDNSGKKYSLTTFKTLGSAPTYVSVSGNITNMPTSKEAVVIGQIKDLDSTGSTGNSGLISTVVDENSKWILSIADTRTSTGSDYFEYTGSDKMYFSVLSTTPVSDATSVLLNGIASKTISITLQSSTKTTTVTKLTSYGVI